MDDSLIVRPRPKRNVLPPPPKKRRTTSTIEEINFDFNARADYLTGFHKRKVQRTKAAQEQAAKLAREERIALRKKLKMERRQELEEHIQVVNKMLREAMPHGLEEPESGEEGVWGGIEGDEGSMEMLDRVEEYVDEDRYTTVTVEEVDISKDGLNRVPREEEIDEMDNVKGEGSKTAKDDTVKKRWPKKLKKFRYESKAERRVTRGKQKAGNKAKADARRGRG